MDQRKALLEAIAEAETVWYQNGGDRGAAIQKIADTKIRPALKALNLFVLDAADNSVKTIGLYVRRLRQLAERLKGETCQPKPDHVAPSSA